MDLKKEPNEKMKPSIRKISSLALMLSLSASLILGPLQQVSVVSASETEIEEGIVSDEEVTEEATEIEATSQELDETQEESNLTQDPASEGRQAAEPANLNEVNEPGEGDGTNPDESGNEDPSEDIPGEDESEEDLPDDNPIVDTREETDETVLPFETQYVEDNSILVGEEVISQEGTDGLLTQRFLITEYENGEIERELIDESREEAVPRIVLVGTLVEEPEPDPEPDPEPEPEPDPTPDPGEDDPFLGVEPIFPNAQEISGYANSSANIVVFYPGTDKQRSTTVAPNGYWTIRNVAGDANYLTEGATVPMLLIHNGEEHYYDQFYVQADDGIVDNYAAEVNPSDTSSTDNGDAKEEEPETTPSNEEDPELLPETGVADDKVEMLGFTSLTAGFALIAVSKRKDRKIKN